MKTLLAALLFSTVSHAAPIVASKDNSLSINKVNGEIEVSIPADAKKALTEWNPEFVVFNLKDYSPSVLDLFKDDKQQTPMVFVADFENNGEQDIALLGSDLKRQFAVALVQNKKKWTVIELKSWSIEDIKKTPIPGDDPSVSTGEVGIPLYISPAIGPQAKKLGKKIGIQVETYMGPGAVYEIQKNQAKQVILTEKELSISK